MAEGGSMRTSGGVFDVPGSRLRRRVSLVAAVAVAASVVVTTPSAAFDDLVNTAPGDTTVFGTQALGDTGETVLVADVNDDFVDDLIVGTPNAAGGDAGTLSIYLGTFGSNLVDEGPFTDIIGQGLVDPDVEITGRSGFGRLIEVGNLDGNTGAELVVADDNDVWIFEYPTEGFFDFFTEITPLAQINAQPADLEVADFDTALGRDDLAIGLPDLGQVQIFEWTVLTTDGVPTVTIQGSAIERFGERLAAGEMIAPDGLADDLFVSAPLYDQGSFFEAGRVFGFDQPGVGGDLVASTDFDWEFFGDTSQQQYFGTDVILADIVGDPSLDLVVASRGSAGNSDSIVFYQEGPLDNGGTRSDQSMGAAWTPGFAPGTLSTLAAGDVDSDFLTDLAAGGDDQVFVLEHDNGVEWSFTGDAGTGFGASIAIADGQYMAVGAPRTDTNVVSLEVDAGAVELFRASVPANGYVVNSTADLGDAAPGDGTCETTNTGECTLRAAIEENNVSGLFSITFDIPGPAPHVIDVDAPLPAIISAASIDGFTQPGAGSSAFGSGEIAIGLRYTGPATADVDGLLIQGDESAVRGLAISGFTRSAINVESQFVTIEGNRLGIRTADLALASPNQAGVTISPDARFVTIQGNVVSNNSNVGIDALGSGVFITLNRIGTSADGTQARPNGVGINLAEAVGGTGGLEVTDNLISGNDEFGVLVKSGDIDLRGNRIGVGVDDQPLPNASGGIYVDFSTGSPVTGIIGSTDPVDGNEIAFNGGNGITVAGESTLAIVGNSIGGNDGLGIDLFDDGVSANDAGDADFPGNGPLNTAVIDSASIVGPDVVVDFTLDLQDTPPNTEYRVEFFASDACDPSGSGEGVRFLVDVDRTIAGGPLATSTTMPLASLNGLANLTATVTLQTFADLGSVTIESPMTTSEFSNCVSVLSDAEIGSITLSVDQAATGPGVTSVPIADIPVEAILGAAEDETATEAAPLGAIPLGAIDLSASPLGAIPLGAIPLGAIPLGAIPLGAIPLSAIPVDFEGGWSAILVGTSFEGQLPQAVTIDQLLAEADLLPATHPLNSIPLGAIDLSASPLGAVSLAALALGEAELSVVSPELCADAASRGLDCATTGNTLIGLELAGYDITASPLGAIPLGAIPLGAIPLGAIPLGAIPLGAIPLGAIPLGAIPLGAIPLGAIELGSAPLGAIPLSAIPLGAIPLGAIPLGAIPLSAIDIEGTPLGAIPLGAISFGALSGCDLVDDVGESCGLLGLDETSTLSDYLAATGSDSLAASPLGAIPLSAIPLGAIPLGAIPLGAIPLGAIPLSAIPLGAIPLGAIDLQGTPLGAIPLGAIDTGSASGCDLLSAFALDCVTLGLNDASTLYELALVLEANGSSLGASPLGAIPLSAIPLSAIVIDDTAGVTTLADLFDLGPDATVADLPPEVIDELSLADVLIALLISSDYPWEEIDLVALGVQDYVPTATEITYTLQIDGVTAAGTIEASVELPFAYRYRVGSSVLGGGAVLDPVVDQTSAGQTLTWFLDVAAGDNALDFDVSPGLRLGTSTSSASASGSTTTVEITGQAPHTVQTFPEPAAAAVDVLQLGYLTAPSETDVYALAPATEGITTSVFLSHVSEDTDLVLYRPTNAPPPGGDGIDAAPTTNVFEDDGFVQALRNDSEPESLGDIPIDASQALIEASAGRGIGDEEVSDYRSADGVPYGIQVSAYNGATSADPYVLRVKQTQDQPIPTCPPRTLTSPNSDIGSGAIPAGLETLVVFDQGRAQAIHGAAGAAQMLGSAQALVDFLNDPLNGFGGAAIFFTDPVTDFSAWDANPCDWEAADAIAKDVREVLADYAAANESLRYVTIVGDDEVIPFHRQPDATGYANEDTFAPELAAAQNATYGSLSTRHILTDHPYGDPDPIPWLDRFLYLPEVSVGRVLESPAEVAKAIDTFITFGGELDPDSTALVSGYDFLQNGADATADALDANGFGPTTEISGETWTDDDLEGAFLVPDGPRVVSANAHYDYYRALPAAEQKAGEDTYTQQTLFQVDDVEDFLAASGDLERTYMFTMGCHASLSVSDVTIGASGVPGSDWAQTYAGNGGVMTGNTGYGYGDTITVGLTEELIVKVAESLDGSLSLGQAVVNALNEYYGEAGLYGVYDEKVIQQFTTYGLPMYRVPGTGSTADGPEPTVTVDPFTGQPSATVFTNLDPIEITDTPYGTLYSYQGQTLDIHYRPIQPMTSRDVTVDGLVARGAIITDWTSTDIDEPDIAYSRPVVDDSDREAEVEDDSIVFPSTFAAIAGFERPNPGEGPRTESRQNLNLVLGQYDGPNDNQRLFDDIESQVFYVAADSPLLDDTAPVIIDQVQAGIVDGQVGFIVDLDDNAAAARVVVLYRPDSSLEWESIDLVSGSPWSGGAAVPAGTTEVEFLVQAVKPSGLSSVSSSKGTLHRARPAPATPPPPSLGVEIAGANVGDWYVGPVTVKAPGAVSATLDGAPVPPGEFTIVDDGVHFVDLVGADGVTTTIVVAVDQSAPQIGSRVPTTLAFGSFAVFDYECRDAGSGVVTCDGPPIGSPIDTSVAGTFGFTVTSSDLVGNEVSQTFSYTVLEPPSVSLTVDPGITSVGGIVTATIELDSGAVASAVVDWGDGSTPGTGLVSTHAYALPGIYTVEAEVTFADGSVVTAVDEVVVFDPNGSYFAGNGTIDAPAGSYTPDPSAAGRVDVQFNPKYAGNGLKGHLKIKGKAIDLDVITDRLDYSIVSGAMGVAQGIGTLDGGSVIVLVAAIDGDFSPSDGYTRDEVSVTITEVATGNVVFSTPSLPLDGNVRTKN